MAEAPSLPHGTLLKDRYRLLDPIGRGGMAVVYRALDCELNKEVAVKVLIPKVGLSRDEVRRFEQEADAIAQLHHPNIIAIEGKGEKDGVVFLVMELLAGESLDKTLRSLQARGETMPWQRLAPMMLHVCHGLQAAHAKHVIHRDIKPSNCLRVDYPGYPDFIKILDFGIAKVRKRRQGQDAADSGVDLKTAEEIFLGTPHFAAPEAIEAPSSELDARADQFSVGVMMYQLLTGSLPFEGKPYTKVLYETPEPPRSRAPKAGISPDVEAVVLKAMARNPDARFSSIGELADAIRAASRLDHDTPTRPPEPEPEPEPKPEGIQGPKGGDLGSSTPTTGVVRISGSPTVERTVASGRGRQRTAAILGPALIILSVVIYTWPTQSHHDHPKKTVARIADGNAPDAIHDPARGNTTPAAAATTVGPAENNSSESQKTDSLRIDNSTKRAPGEIVHTQTDIPKTDPPSKTDPPPRTDPPPKTGLPKDPRKAVLKNHLAALSARESSNDEICDIVNDGELARLHVSIAVNESGILRIRSYKETSDSDVSLRTKQLDCILNLIKKIDIGEGPSHFDLSYTMEID